MQAATTACKDAYKAWCQAKGITYKDPEKWATEKSLAAAITYAQRGGKKFTGGYKNQGNGYKSRGRGPTGPTRQGRYNGSYNRGDKTQYNSNRRGKIGRGGRSSRGKFSGKRQAGSNEQKE